jgi:hypothetical protein
MFDEGFKSVTYSYFNTGVIIERSENTYADLNAPLSHDMASWIHPISDILQSLMDAGLQLIQFREWDHSPYSCFKEVEEYETGRFRIKHLGNKIPMVYGIVASKPQQA